MKVPETFSVRKIANKVTHEWILNKHYAKRIPSISFAFGLYTDFKLVGVCTFGLPPNPFLCVGICGKKYRDIVIELNRLCINDDTPPNTTSFFVGQCLKLLPKPKIVVSYADTEWGHLGKIYQATNWIYTGKTKPLKDKKIVGSGKHARHNNIYENKEEEWEYVTRSEKHRYIFFIGNKGQIKRMKKELKYPILPYPQGKTARYDANFEPTNVQTIDKWM